LTPSTSSATRWDLDAEALRLVQFYYDQFLHAGAKLSDADKAELKKLNEEESTLSHAFNTKLLAATKEGAFVATDKNALAGVSQKRLDAAAQAAKERKGNGYVIPLQNTTQQPDLGLRSASVPRARPFLKTPGIAPSAAEPTIRAILSARLAQLRAQKTKLLGFPNYAAWRLEDQMAKNPETALKFMDELVPGSTARADASRPKIFRP
jgi:peptidyl-dipeptidase Dcp